MLYEVITELPVELRRRGESAVTARGELRFDERELGRFLASWSTADSFARLDLDEPRQIVCGASNVAQGQRVAVIRPGDTLPGGMKIKKAKIRGAESFGMIRNNFV